MREGVILCRCEDLSVRDLERVAQQLGDSSLESLKRHSRVTMGPCQGRVCRPWLERLRSALEMSAGPSPNSVADLPLAGNATMPGFRPPVRPVRVADVAASDPGAPAPWGDKEAP